VPATYQRILAQRAQILDELPHFPERLSFSDVAEEFDEVFHQLKGVLHSDDDAHR
jgi:hypothetical protein